MRKQYFHDAHGGEHFTPTQGHDGSSARMAMAVGGRINAEVSSPGSWAPVTVYKNLVTRTQWLFSHLRQIGLPGMITVDQHGKRFGNEALSYHDFGRGSTAYNYVRGDMDKKPNPNPNLATIDQAPFYAAKVRMGDLGSFARIDVDSRHVVVRADGKRIPGLYSVGAAAVSVFGGGYPGYGSHIGPALVFGYRMGRDIAELASESGSADALERALEVKA